MKSIFLTGSTGFIGKNLKKKFQNKYRIFDFIRSSTINIKENVVIHLAGLSHDTNKKYNLKTYYEVNTKLTIDIFDKFLKSNSSDFIFLSSVKAVKDFYDEKLDETVIETPTTYYGLSKLKAEKYIFSKKIPHGKRVIILRPCMIYGPENKGNLNLLYKMVSKGYPWPLGSYENKRSYCSINNLIFVIDQIINHKNILSGIYNLSDDEPLSTNELVRLIYESKNKKPFIIKIPKVIISLIAKIGDFLPMPLNSERLKKLTSSYIVSNTKISKALKIKLPDNSKKALLRVFKNFR